MRNRRRQYVPLPRPAAILLLILGGVLIAAAIAFEAVFPYNGRATALNQELQRIDYTHIGQVTGAKIYSARNLTGNGASASPTRDTVLWSGNILNSTVSHLRSNGYACKVTSTLANPTATCNRVAASGTFQAVLQVQGGGGAQERTSLRLM